MLRDSFGGAVDSLRLSLTDRCDIRCVSRMPPEGVPLKPMEEILTYGELLRVVRVAVSRGIRRRNFSMPGIREALRGDAGDGDLADPFRRTMEGKPMSHGLCEGGTAPSTGEPMSRAGG